MQYKLTISYPDFVEKLKKVIREANEFEKNNENIEKLEDNLSLLDKIVYNIFDKYFKPDSTILKELYFTDYNHNYIAKSMFANEFKHQVIHHSHLDYVITKKIRSIENIIDYMSITDSILLPNQLTPPINTITQKKDFLLKKLHQIFNDNHYSIKTIFLLNDISYRDGENEELAEDLAKRGYVQREEKYRGENVKLTIKGASYVERKEKSKNARTSKKTSSNPNDLNKKLDDITERLKALGYGQEIIFNEIEELRELQTSLSKRNWTQLLKGKLIDMSIEKVISKEAVFMIYEFLTNDRLKLM